mgnify:CR=1 FL=1
MKYESQSALACLQDTKNASLYFDNVVPLELSELIPIRDSGEPEMFEILNSILPSNLLDSNNPRGVNPLVIQYTSTYLIAFPSALGIFDLPNNETLEERHNKHMPKLLSDMSQLIHSSGCSASGIFGAVANTNQETAQEDPSLILSGLNLVDASKLSWKQILEIRDDKESINKLKRLRLFIYENYNDKPLNYIKDDLNQRIYDYENTAKELGLKTKESIFKAIFSSESTVGLTAAAIASAFLAAPIAIPLSLAIGSTFMIGNIALDFKSQKRELYNFKRDNPISYIVDIKK